MIIVLLRFVADISFVPATDGFTLRRFSTFQEAHDFVMFNYRQDNCIAIYVDTDKQEVINS
jgi:hypothetical protein